MMILGLKPKSWLSEASFKKFHTERVKATVHQSQDFYMSHELSQQYELVVAQPSLLEACILSQMSQIVSQRTRVKYKSIDSCKVLASLNLPISLLDKMLNLESLELDILNELCQLARSSMSKQRSESVESTCQASLCKNKFKF